MDFKSHPDQPFNDLLNLLLGRAFLHCYNHLFVASLPTASDCSLAVDFSAFSSERLRAQAGSAA
jgi:hypothetical protein